MYPGSPSKNLSMSVSFKSLTVKSHFMAWRSSRSALPFAAFRRKWSLSKKHASWNDLGKVLHLHLSLLRRNHSHTVRPKKRSSLPPNRSGKKKNRGGVDITSHDWVIGTELTQFDADTYVLARAAETLAQCYTPEVAPPLRIFFFCSSLPALQAVQNMRSNKAHTYALRFHKALTTFFSSHKDVQLVLCWALKDDDLEGDRMARALAAAACRRNLANLPNGMDCILSVAYQKDRAHRRAFHQWELDYHLDRAHNNLQISATGLPLDGAAYQYAISLPPSEVNHPLWSAVVAMEKDERGRKTRCPLFPRQTTSTALQLAVNHAFTGSYTSRFRPLDLLSSLTCTCGHPICNPHHLIRDCCLHYLTRISCKITTRGRTLPLKSLFSHSVEHAHCLLSFIHRSCVAMHPPEIGQPIPVEPEPD
jgi:hypothetical protein